MKKLSLLLILLSCIIVCCKTEPKIKGFYEAMHLSRKGGGNIDFFVYPTDSSNKLKIVVDQIDFNDTLIELFIYKNNENTPIFIALSDAMNNKIQVNKSFNFVEFDKGDTGTWLYIYLLADKKEIEVTNETLLNTLGQFESLIHEAIISHGKTILSTNSSKERSNIDTIKKNEWIERNDKLFEKYKVRIEFSDIESVFKILLKEKIIDQKININNNYYPEICYMSPTAQIGKFVKGSVWADQPDSLRFFTQKDHDFILDQFAINQSKEFRWSSLTNKIDSTESYPRYHISCPAFSLDKNKFILCIETYTNEHCMKGESFIFVKNKKGIKKRQLDSVRDCK